MDQPSSGEVSRGTPDPGSGVSSCPACPASPVMAAPPPESSRTGVFTPPPQPATSTPSSSNNVRPVPSTRLHLFITRRTGTAARSGQLRKRKSPASGVAGLGSASRPYRRPGFMPPLDDASFEGCYRRVFPLVLAKCRRMLKGDAEAHDVAQEVFVRLWRHRELVQDPRALTAWLYRTSTHLVISRARQRAFSQENLTHLHRLLQNDVV